MSSSDSSTASGQTAAPRRTPLTTRHCWALDRPLTGYAVAVTVTLLFIVIRAALAPVLPADAPLLLFPAVVIATLVGGGGPGMVATLLAGLCGAYFFLSPPGFAIEQPGDQLRLVLFLAMGLTISLLGEGLWYLIRLYRAAYARLQVSEARLRDAARHKDELLMMLAHELRGPLEPLHNIAASLGLSGAAPGLGKVLERQIGHLGRLVDGLLETARIDAVVPVLQCQVLDLKALVAQTLDDYAGVFATARVTLRAEPPAEPVWVEGDAIRLAQMLGQLLDNARQFTPAGGQVTVGLEADHETGKARLRVIDTGAGLEPAMLEHVFEPFFQVSQGLARQRGGLGLGLTMVRRLAQLHRGDVTVSSAGPGRGTALRVTLPLTAAPPATGGNAPGAVAAARILVIDDNADTAQTLAQALTLLGHTTVSAATGAEGLARTREFRPQVVICDIGLPDIDGYAVARALRGESGEGSGAGTVPQVDVEPDPKLWLIALTGYGSDQDKRNAKAAGFDVHLTKPAQLDLLCAAIARRPAIS